MSAVRTDFTLHIKYEPQEKKPPNIVLRVVLDNTIEEIKQRIFENRKHPIESQKIFFSNVEVENSKTLRDISVPTRRGWLLLKLIQESSPEPEHKEPSEPSSPVSTQQPNTPSCKTSSEDSKNNPNNHKTTVLIVIFVAIVFFGYRYMKNRPSKELGVK